MLDSYEMLNDVQYISNSDSILLTQKAVNYYSSTLKATHIGSGMPCHEAFFKSFFFCDEMGILNTQWHNVMTLEWQLCISVRFLLKLDMITIVWFWHTRRVLPTKSVDILKKVSVENVTTSKRGLHDGWYSLKSNNL